MQNYFDWQAQFSFVQIILSCSQDVNLMQEVLSSVLHVSYFEWRGLCVGSCRQTPRVPLIYMPPIDGEAGGEQFKSEETIA